MQFGMDFVHSLKATGKTKNFQDYTLLNLIFISAGVMMRNPELNTQVLILEAAFNHLICAITNQTHIPILKNC